MAAMSATCREARFGQRTLRYERHRPEQTLLYQVVERHYPHFLETLEAQGQYPPKYVRQEFEDYLNAWNTAFCACAALRAIPRSWSPSVGRSCASMHGTSGAAFVPHAVRSAWWKARRY
jgi:hypothetical protein